MNAVKRAAIVPIGSPDERAIAAIRRADHLLVERRTAVHVARDQRAAAEIRRWWSHLAASDWDLHVTVGASVPSTVIAEVRTAISAGYEEVVVVVGFMAHGSVTRRLAHDHTAETICTAVSHLPGAAAVLVPVSDVGRRARCAERTTR